jgi:hypothetical protein
VVCVTRPFGVVFVAILLVLGALFNLILGFMLIFAIWEPRDIANATVNVGGFWLFVSGALSIVLALIYLWISRLALAGSQTAYVLINFLAIINIIFALFSLPIGWGMIALNVLVLIAVNTANAKNWLSQSA